MPKKVLKKSKKTNPKFVTEAHLDKTLAIWGGELTRRIDNIEKNMATKQDLEGFATKDDLEKFATKQELERFATKEELQNVKTGLETTIKESEKRIIFEFKALAENIHHDLAGANKDEISAIKDKNIEQDQEIAKIKAKVGMLS